MTDEEYLHLVVHAIEEQKEAERREERKIRTVVLIGLSPWIIGIMAVLISLIVDCATPQVDPLDVSSSYHYEVVEHVEIRDSTGNGFRVVYATASPVSTARLKEIRRRPKLKETFERLKKEALVRFGGDLLDADIHQFAALAKKHVPGSLTIRNIFVCGVEKYKLYLQPNPAIENCATRYVWGCEQGAQYLKAEDIYYHYRPEQRRYRYWKCFGVHSISRTDERFSHFSEDERL